MNAETIQKEMVLLLEDMTSDWDTAFQGAVGPETRLIADLAFESIDVVQLIVAIEERFGRKDLPFVELVMQNGRYVDELRVADIVAFLARHLK